MHHSCVACSAQTTHAASSFGPLASSPPATQPSSLPTAFLYDVNAASEIDAPPPADCDTSHPIASGLDIPLAMPGKHRVQGLLRKRPRDSNVSMPVSAGGAVALATALCSDTFEDVAMSRSPEPAPLPAAATAADYNLSVGGPGASKAAQPFRQPAHAPPVERATSRAASPVSVHALHDVPVASLPVMLSSSPSAFATTFAPAAQVSSFRAPAMSTPVPLAPAAPRCRGFAADEEGASATAEGAGSSCPDSCVDSVPDTVTSTGGASRPRPKPKLSKRGQQAGGAARQ